MERESTHPVVGHVRAHTHLSAGGPARYGSVCNGEARPGVGILKLHVSALSVFFVGCPVLFPAFCFRSGSCSFPLGVCFAARGTGARTPRCRHPYASCVLAVFLLNPVMFLFRGGFLRSWAHTRERHPPGLATYGNSALPSHSTPPHDRRMRPFGSAVHDGHGCYCARRDVLGLFARAASDVGETRSTCVCAWSFIGRTYAHAVPSLRRTFCASACVPILRDTTRCSTRSITSLYRTTNLDRTAFGRSFPFDSRSYFPAPCPAPALSSPVFFFLPRARSRRGCGRE